LTSFPKTINSHLEAFLLDAARHITILAAPFRSSSLNDDLEDTFSIEDEDGTTLTLPMVLSNILLFILDASRKGPGKAALVNKTTNEPTEILTQIIYLAIYLGQITTEDEERWTSDMGAFVEDEDEDMPASSLRTASLDLVFSLLTSFPHATIRALTAAVSRIIQESDKLQSEGQQDWWKGYESCLDHLSHAAEELSEHVAEAQSKGQPSQFDLEKAFETLVAPFLSRPSRPR
jgi:hypothetical protein